MGLGEELAVEAPASIANLGPAFDVAAMAIRPPVDIVRVRVSEGSGIVVENEGDYAGELPEKPELNSAYYVAKRALELANIEASVRIRVFKGIKPASGLGSSGATSAATAYAMNRLLGLKLDDWGLVELASYGELASAGVRHMDNVAASLFGGVVLVNRETRRVIRLPPPNMHVLVVVVGSKPNTGYMRSVLPKSYGLDDVVNNMANVAQLISSLLTGNPELFAEVVDKDRVAMPYRVKLYEHWNIVKATLERHGALAVTLSGAGPSIVGFFKDKPPVEGISAELSSRGVKAALVSSRPSSEGVRVLDFR